MLEGVLEDEDGVPDDAGNGLILLLLEPELLVDDCVAIVDELLEEVPISD